MRRKSSIVTFVLGDNRFRELADELWLGSGDGGGGGNGVRKRMSGFVCE